MAKAKQAGVAARELPIQMTAESVLAIFAGRKTQTRRVIKVPAWLQRLEPDLSRAFPDKAMGVTPCLQVPCADGTVQRLRNPWGFPDVVPIHLWVRETWGAIQSYDSLVPRDIPQGSSIGYKAAADIATWCQTGCDGAAGKWRPGIFMPRWASRITLELIDVRAEKLQEITNDDARAEGMPHASPHRHGVDGIVREAGAHITIPDAYAAKHNTGINDCWICMYRMAWNHLNLKRGFGWTTDPFVWVLTFREIKQDS